MLSLFNRREKSLVAEDSNDSVEVNLLKIIIMLEAYRFSHIYKKGGQFNIASAFGNIIEQLKFFIKQLQYSINEGEVINEAMITETVHQIIQSCIRYSIGERSLHGQKHRMSEASFCSPVIVSKEGSRSFNIIDKVYRILKVMQAGPVVQGVRVQGNSDDNKTLVPCYPLAGGNLI